MAGKQIVQNTGNCTGYGKVYRKWEGVSEFERI
jgi:hypothetical protein